MAAMRSVDGRSRTRVNGFPEGSDQCRAPGVASNSRRAMDLTPTKGVNSVAAWLSPGSGVRMLQGWVVIAVALAYIGLLFLVASYGDRDPPGRAATARSRLLIYPLSLAIYCTSWTFFGSVGSASRTGYEFLTIYIGPVLMIGLFAPLLVAHRAAGQGAEHHLDRRLHRRALRQGPGGGGDRGADRHRRHRSLHRAAAQGGVGLARDHHRAYLARTAASRSRCSATSRCSWRCRWRPSPCCSARATSTPPSTRTA